MYEYLSGDLMNPPRPGQQIPVPPQEIRERLRLPKKYQNATLHKDLAEEYASPFREKAIEYLMDVSRWRGEGASILFAGPRRSGTSRIAAALMNEMVLRTTHLENLDGAWLSCFHVLSILLDAKQLGRHEQYFRMRDQMMKTDILVIDELLATRTKEAWYFVEDVMAYRDDNHLPVIVTVTTGAAGVNVMEAVRKRLGKRLSERLNDMTAGFQAFI